MVGHLVDESQRRAPRPLSQAHEAVASAYVPQPTKASNAYVGPRNLAVVEYVDAGLVGTLGDPHHGDLA